MIKNTLRLLDKNQKVNFFLLLSLAVFVAILELSTIVSIYPFLTVIGSPIIIQENQYLKLAYDLLNAETDNEFIFYLGMAVILVFLLRAIFSMVLTVLRMIFTRYFHVKLTEKLFKHYLNIGYRDFNRKHSSVSTEIIVNETLYVTNSVNDLIIFFTEVILICLIISTLLFIDWKITSLTLITFGLLAVITIPITKILTTRGIERANTQMAIYDLLSEAVSNFKAIKILSSSMLFTNKLALSLEKFAKNQIWYVSVAELPKYFIEISALTFLILLILNLNSSSADSASWLPIVSTLAMAFYRLLPSVNRIISTFNQLRYNRKATEVILGEFALPLENVTGDQKFMTFKDEISFCDISINYGEKSVLVNADLSIMHGEKIALTGPSGSGKTTFLDMIMGIILPDNGKVIIDNETLSTAHIQSWRSQIGYVPQGNYLLNDTVDMNIAFGRKHDEKKINEALDLANLSKDPFFSQQGESKIGEGGNKLSGGQKQRLMIARAAYENPSIIILDEPTSALDSESEEIVMKEIFESFQDKTIIIVSHREEAIKGCDRYISIKNGKFIES